MVRWAIAKSKAQELIRKSGIGEAWVPVEKIAESIGAMIRFQPFEGDVSGMAHRHEGRAIIGVNSIHPETRQRFTIAHEIGHLVLHQHDEIHVDEQLRSAANFRNEVSSLGVDDEEIEANQFAAELLMPEEFLKRDIEIVKAREPEAAIAELADRYKVSVQSMAIRLSKLGLIR